MGCTVHLRRCSDHSLLFSGTLHSAGYLSLSPLPFASLLFSAIVSLPQTTTLLSCISPSLGWFWLPPPIQCYKPLSIVLRVLYQIKSLESVHHLQCIIVTDLI